MLGFQIPEPAPGEHKYFCVLHDLDIVPAGLLEMITVKRGDKIVWEEEFCGNFPLLAEMKFPADAGLYQADELTNFSLGQEQRSPREFGERSIVDKILGDPGREHLNFPADAPGKFF